MTTKPERPFSTFSLWELVIAVVVVAAFVASVLFWVVYLLVSLLRAVIAWT